MCVYFQSQNCCFMTFVVHMLKLTLKACIKGHCMITLTSWFIIVQLMRANTTIGCFYFTQSIFFLLSWILQQSIMQTSFDFLSIKFARFDCASRVTRFYEQNPSFFKTLTKWLSLNVKSQTKFMRFIFPLFEGGKH